MNGFVLRCFCRLLRSFLFKRCHAAPTPVRGLHHSVAKTERLAVIFGLNTLTVGIFIPILCLRSVLNGRLDSEATEHLPVLRAEDPGLPETSQENYRIGGKGKGLPGSAPDAPHYGSKESAAMTLVNQRARVQQRLTLDSDYTNPTGPSTTRANLATPASMKGKK